METLRITCTAFFMILFSTVLPAQNIRERKINKTTEVVQQINKDVNAIKNLFGKKSKSAKSENSGYEEPEKGSNNSSPAPKKDSLKPGDIHPNAKVLDVDEMWPFNGGAAVVRKGVAYALIDSGGTFVVPFNKYRYVVYSGVTSGFFEIWGKNLNERFVTNAKGEMLGESGMEYMRLTEDGRYAVFFKGDKNDVRRENKLVYLDKNKRRFIVDAVSGASEFGNDGIKLVYAPAKGNQETSPYKNLFKGVVLRNTNSLSYAYMNLNNEIVTKEVFDYGRPFSDGMACVGKRNEFGEMKYGFININGEVTIPLIYSNQPSDFVCGRARVMPKEKTEFDYAYINKRGETVIKRKDANVGGFGSFSKSGFAFIGAKMMDTTGQVFNTNDFFSNAVNRISPKEYVTALYYSPELEKHIVDDGKIHFEILGRENGVAYYDLKTKRITGFFSFNRNVYFDPVSRLAYAEKYLGKDKLGKNIIRKGYINEDGIFMIVMGEMSKW